VRGSAKREKPGLTCNMKFVCGTECTGTRDKIKGKKRGWKSSQIKGTKLRKKVRLKRGGKGQKDEKSEKVGGHRIITPSKKEKTEGGQQGKGTG